MEDSTFNRNEDQERTSDYRGKVGAGGSGYRYQGRGKWCPCISFCCSKHQTDVPYAISFHCVSRSERYRLYVSRFISDRLLFIRCNAFRHVDQHRRRELSESVVLSRCDR